MKSFEIYWDDLCPDAQVEYLKFSGVKSVSELNVECIPITIIDLEEEDG